MNRDSELSASILRAIGLDTDHLKSVDGTIMASSGAAEAFWRLKSRAEGAGIALRIASGHRDYGRQLAIFNDKMMGARPVLSEDGLPLCRDDYTDWDWLQAVLRFSALPGLSRHHWGTDFDVWDAAAVPDDYRLALVSAEYLPGGPFHRFSCWFSEREARQESESFFRPYETDTGGVAPEPWHISFRGSEEPKPEDLVQPLTRLWSTGTLAGINCSFPPLAYASLVVDHADELLDRYVVINRP